MNYPLVIVKFRDVIQDSSWDGPDKVNCPTITSVGWLPLRNRNKIAAMKLLSKFFLAIFLLAVASLGWTACPEGTKNNYKGECVGVAGSLSSGTGWKFGPSMGGLKKEYGHQGVSAPDHPVRYGKYSERFEVRPGDCSRNDCKTDRERSELTQLGDTQKEGDEYWYRWSIYMPEDHQNIYLTKNTYGQFHQGGFFKCSVVFMFQEFWGGYWLNILPAITEKVTYTSDDNRNLLEPEDFIGKWNDIVVHARWTKKDDGWFKVWVNGEEKTSWEGKTMTCKEVYFKYGVYRFAVSRSLKSKTVTTIAYYDGLMRSKSKEGMFDPLPE